MATARPLAPTQPHLARLRVDRQHRLIEELRLTGGRHATAEELAAALRVDVRTVERDIARLRDAGVPIAARLGPGGGFRLDVPPTVAPVHLSPGEIAALIASVVSVGPYVSATARSAPPACCRPSSPSSRAAEHTLPEPPGDQPDQHPPDEEPQVPHQHMPPQRDPVLDPRRLDHPAQPQGPDSHVQPP